MPAETPGMTLTGTEVPRLARGVKKRFDSARDRHVLLGPEAVVVLNGTGTAVLELCDGRTVDEIVAALVARSDADASVVTAHVHDFLTRLAARHCVRLEA